MEEKTRSEQRKIYYRDVEVLVEKGFLLHNLLSFRSPISLRTLFPDEIKDVFILSLGKGVYSYRCHLISKALYAVNGISLFPVPYETTFSLVQSFPKPLLQRLYFEVLGLMDRYQKGLNLAHAYAFESYSRAVWNTHAGIPKNAFGKTNGIQDIWQYVNVIEDQQNQNEVAWNHAKFIASAMSPKGVKKQNSKDESKRKQMLEKREQFIERSIAFSVDAREESEKPRQILVNATTNSELMEEYHRWVKGDQDAHDKIVSDYKEKIRKNMADRERTNKERVDTLIKEGGSRGVFAATLVADPEKLSGFKSSGVRSMRHEGSQKRLYDRFLGREEVGGEFYLDDNGQVRHRG